MSVTHFFFYIPPFEVFDIEQIARGWGLIQERLLGCFLVKIDFFPLKELRDGCVLQKRCAAGHRHLKPHSHSLKEQATGQGNPKIILLEFHLQQGCQGWKLTGAA